MVKIDDYSEWIGFECYLLETVAARTFPRDQFVVRWRIGPADYFAPDMQMIVASAEKKT